MATSDWSQLGTMLPSSWMSAPKPLQPGDYGYTPPGMVSYSGEPPHLPYNTAPTSGGFNGGMNDSFGPTAGAVANPNATAAAAWGSSGAPNYDQQVNALYASIGKTPDMIDQQGRDFWGGRIAAGEDVTNAFNQSAGTTYRNMVNGQSSPYAAQNAAGFSNAQDMMRAGDSNLQGIMEGSGMSTGQIGVFDDNHPNGVYPGPYNPNYGKSTVGGSPSLQSYQQNPYLAQMGEGLRTQFTGFMNDGLAANRGAAVATGGVGGSRQGIAEARTMTDAGKGFDSALANLYGNDYQAQMGRNLQQYGMDQGYSLGLGNLALGNKTADNSYNLGLGSLDLQGRGQDQNFYTAQRGQDQTGAALGMNMYNLGMQGPWNTLNNANGLATPYTGQGTTTTNTSSGGGAQGAIGGAMGTYQLGKNMGWW